MTGDERPEPGTPDPGTTAAGAGGPGDALPMTPDSRAVHGGDFHDGRTGARTPPIQMSTVFEFDSVGEMAATFRGERPAYIYSRYANPTVEIVERHIAALEGGEAALAVSSGMAAISTALLSILSAGDHLVACADLYGGTRNLFDGIFRRLGITTSYFPIEDLTACRAALRPETRALYIESPTNPTLKVADIRGLVAVAGAAGVPVVIDNTFATPLLQRPLELGCRLVIHSATKALAGHDDVTAGLIVGSATDMAAAREVMKWLGGCLDPHAAWLLERGMKTLALRVRRQCDNAMFLAERLAGHPAVGRVHYPGLPDHPGHSVARRQMSAFGGLLAFELESAAAVERMSGRLRMIRLAPTLGGVETIYLVPAVSSHIRLSPDERQLIGVTDGMVRVSCGIEHPADLWADLSGALHVD